MASVVRSAYTFVRLYLMRRSQLENMELRRYFERNHDIHVGLYSYGCFDRWRMPGPMRVGRYCSFAATVRSALQNHPTNGLTTHPVLYDPAIGVVDTGLPPAEPLIVEDDVWVGHNAIILPGCKLIGRGAIIGAGSVVTRNVARYEIVAGNPARPLKSRFSTELIEQIEASRWWELDLLALRDLVSADPNLVLAPTVPAMEAWARGRSR